MINVTLMLWILFMDTISSGKKSLSHSFENYNFVYRSQKLYNKLMPHELEIMIFCTNCLHFYVLIVNEL